MSFKESFCEILETMNLAELSRKSGIGFSTLAKCRDGSIPKLNTFIAIADATNVNYEWLATGRGTKHKEEKKKKDVMEWLKEFQEEFPELKINIEMKEKNEIETQINSMQKKRLA